MPCNCIQLERDLGPGGPGNDMLRFVWKDVGKKASMLCYGPMGHFQRTEIMTKEKARLVWAQLRKVGWTLSGPAFELTFAHSTDLEYKNEINELKNLREIK